MNILDFIPIGKDHPVKREALMSVMRLPDREIRAMIEQERRNGHIIINLQDGRGYYRPAESDFESIMYQYRQNKSRAMSVLVQQKYLRRALKAAGQL